MITPEAVAAALELVREAQIFLQVDPSCRVAQGLLRVGDYFAAGALAPGVDWRHTRDALGLLLVREMDTYPPTYDAVRAAGRRLIRHLR